MRKNFKVFISYASRVMIITALFACAPAALFSSCGASLAGGVPAIDIPGTDIPEIYLPVVYNREFYYFDTFIEVKLYAYSEQHGLFALDEAEAVFKRVHMLMSRFDEDSDIYRINNASPGEKPVKVDAETFALIKIAIEYCAQSGGAFDIGIGAASDLWGFGSSNDDAPDYIKQPPDEDLLAEAVAAGGYKKIILDENEYTVDTPAGLIIDLGGIAKGYATQSVADALKELGIDSAVINAGGNVYVLGEKPEYASSDSAKLWKVGIRHPRPERDDELLAVVSLTDKSIVTSGDYERYFEYEGTRYHHILDPSTGNPAGESISATVIADDSVLADYLSTALFVLGAQKGLELVALYPGAEAIIVAPDMTVASSPGFDGDIRLINKGD